MTDFDIPTIQTVSIPINTFWLEGELAIPPHATGIVIFAHGSGSSRLSPRNQYIADKLNNEAIATLLVDLLTEEEDIDSDKHFNISLLTERLIMITDWVLHSPQTDYLSIGYFGASTGAAAAVLAAEDIGDDIAAIVCRGGRVDMALGAAETLHPPTLLIVGENDGDVLKANELFYQKLRPVKEIIIVPFATHLFEEPGALAQVAELATAWFSKYLKKSHHTE